MKMSAFVAIFVAVTLSSCTTRLSRQSQYLNEVSGRASQDEVAQHLGAPNNTYTLKSGGQVWSYDDCYGGVSGSDGRVTGGMSCVKFVLTFDEKGILRNWVRQ